ncbi:MAG: sugar ABC transporter permease [Clostridia bacterium]|nr:sugar ABC transporter permease [Clostridia bacterium]
MKKYSRPINTELRAMAYLLPALVIIGIFQFYPIFKSFAMGFYTKFDYLTDRVYETGLGNFKYVFSDPDFYLAMKNTCIFVFFAVPLGILIALILAVLIDRQRHLKSFFQSVYFLPFITSTVSVSIVWSWMLNKDFGLVNALLKLFGIPKVAWLTDPNMTLPILIAFSVWKGLGYKIILILAALQGIDTQYYAAARIDGAKAWKQFLHITIPLLKPCLTFLYITSSIGAFKIFDEVYIMYAQQPGPLKSGLTIVYYIFNKFYRHWEFAIAAAAAFVLFLIILLLTVIQFIIADKKER